MFQSHFKPKSASYYDLFDEATRTQLVPALQRIYTWDGSQIEKLFQDVIENDPGYFIGTIVVIGTGSSAQRDEIIDGQQRLTTMSIFMVALRDLIKEIDECEGIIDDINQLLFHQKVNKTPERRLKFTNILSDQIFENLVAGSQLPSSVNDLQKRFLSNYETCKDLILREAPELEFNDIENIFNKFKNLELVCIVCSDKSSAYKLFSSLNATAVSLASTDLIKNSLLMTLASKSDDLARAENRWLTLEENFANDLNLLPKYIRHQWISSGEYTTEPGLFDKFQKKYVDKNDVEDVKKYVNDLLEDSEIYLKFRNANIENLKNLPTRRYDKRELKETLEFLSFLNVDQVYSALLTVYKREKNFKKNLIKLTAFQFLFKHVPGSPSKVETLFAQYSKNSIDLEKLFAELLKLCRNQEDHFIDSFLTKNKYKSGGVKNGDIQFILERYLLTKGPQKAFSKPTIEHIVPQKPDRKDKEELKNLFGDIKTFNSFKHKIGNLTILEEGENSSSDYSNKMFAHKKKSFENDLYKANNILSEYSFEMDPLTAIDDRGRVMACEIYNIFLKSLQTGAWHVKEVKEEGD